MLLVSVLPSAAGAAGGDSWLFSFFLLDEPPLLCFSALLLAEADDEGQRAH